jgi:hypothetical protein
MTDTIRTETVRTRSQDNMILTVKSLYALCWSSDGDNPYSGANFSHAFAHRQAICHGSEVKKCLGNGSKK